MVAPTLEQTMDITLVQLIFRSSICLYGGLSLMLLLMNAKRVTLPPLLEQIILTGAFITSVALIASGISFISLSSVQ